MRANSILRTTYALAIAIAVVRFVTLALSPTSWRDHSLLDFASAGSTYAANIALIVGCLELASRRCGRAAIGGTLAAVGYGLSIAVAFASESLRALTITGGRGAGLAFAWAGIGVGVVITVGFVVAAWDRRRSALVAGAVTLLPYVVQLSLPLLVSDDIDTTMRRFQLAESVAWIARLSALLWLANLAATSDPEPAWPRVARGIRWMAGALWLWIAGLAAFGFLDLFTHTRGELSVLAPPMIWSLVYTGFALGALAVCRGTRVPIFAIAALAILWCAGVAIVQEPWLYVALNTPRSAFFGGEQLATAVPLVMTIAMAVVALAVRRLSPLAAVGELTANQAIAFVVLELASLGLAHAELEFFAILCDAIASAILAMWLRRAAELLVREQPALPTAKLL